MIVPKLRSIHSCIASQHSHSFSCREKRYGPINLTESQAVQLRLDYPNIEYLDRLVLAFFEDTVGHSNREISSKAEL
jgi:hypothetical protein